MVNIWDFILQTVSVSLVAGLILIIKGIFKDKLSPRWQYGMWIILAFRILLPVKANKLVLLPFGVYLEAIKSVIEAKLNSAYASPFTVTEPRHIFPYPSGSPQSITDILFIIYFLGVIVFLLYYFVSYIRLRLALRKGTEIIGEEKERIEELFSANKVSFCKVVYVKGISGAFICGVLRPVLVLPASRQTDEKVLLHEIMHLKHLDSLQSVFWCLLRCLHWCNPVMHYVFNVVGNDMESLCDQRVLEKLHGEERREYGILLLNEVNRKYARMPGTTSVSNGGRNISKRIESIVRFKKYPKGMALVSVCIVIVMSVPCLFVSAANISDNSVYFPKNKFEYQIGVATSRTNRCTTIAGAIDTYAKAMINKNPIMLLTASPQYMQEEIIEKIKSDYTFNTGFSPINSSDTAPFSVFNLHEKEKDRYSATIAFSLYDYKTTEDDDEYYDVPADTLFMPIEVTKERNSWAVKESGKRYKSDKVLSNSVYQQAHHFGKEAPIYCENTIKGKKGTIDTLTYLIFTIEPKSSQNVNIGFIDQTIGISVRDVCLDAEFSSCLADTEFTYQYEGDDYKSVRYVKCQYTRDMAAEFDKTTDISLMNYGSSSTDGSGERAYTVNDNGEWDKNVYDSDLDSNLEPENVMKDFSKQYKYTVYIDGELTEEFEIEVKANE